MQKKVSHPKSKSNKTKYFMADSLVLMAYEQQKCISCSSEGWTSKIKALADLVFVMSNTFLPCPPMSTEQGCSLGPFHRALIPT
jgi:hypothetical protein